MRQVILDTETTGLEPAAGHRIIEIGCVELVSRRFTGRTFQRYLNPERDIDEAALAVHGINRAQLASEPRFAEVAGELLEFISGAELVIHNADFDVGFLDAELARLADAPRSIRALCRVLDTLGMARELHPGQRNSLDALCKRYGVDNSKRELHGALLDARILAEVYLSMTGGQGALALGDRSSRGPSAAKPLAALRDSGPLPIVAANADELAAHEQLLDTIAAASGGRCVWRDADRR
jgi:DNA polymerase-3 subunit epsilon